MTWNIAAQWVVSTKRNSLMNVTFRQVIEPGAIALSGDKIRISIRAANDGRLAITDCFIGKTTAGEVKPGFTTSPTRVKFNSGSNSIVILEGQTVVSDEINLPFNPADGQALTVSFHIPTPSLGGYDILATIGQKNVSGVNLYRVSGNYAGADTTVMPAASFTKDTAMSVLSVTKIEVNTSAEGGDISSILDFNWSIGGTSLAEVSKFTTYEIFQIHSADISRAAIYVISTIDVLSSLVPKWNILGNETVSNIDFKWNVEATPPDDIASSLTFLWNVAQANLPFIKPLQFRWNVNGPITRNISFRWNDLDGTPAEKTISFRWNDYATPEPIDYVVAGLSLSWGVSQSYVDPSRVVYPDVPILETWSFKTAVFRSRTGKEQRRSYLANPVVSLQFSALILDNKGFRDLRQAVEIDTTAFYQVPLFQYYDFVRTNTGPGDTRLYFDPAEVNPIAGTFLAICDDETAETIFLPIETVHVDGCTLSAPVGVNLFAGQHFVCPVRVSRISTDGNAKLYPVHANATYIFVSVDRDKPFIRPGVNPDFVMLGGLIVLDIPISADTDINEDYLSGNHVMDNGRAAPLLYVDEPTRRRFDLIYRMNRLDGPAALDWWRSFALAVCGQWKPFLLPTYRADAVLAAPAVTGASTFTVLGRATYDVFTAGGYFGVMYDTDIGREYREVTAVTLDGNNTVCSIAEPIAADTFEDVSFLMKVRLSEDQIAINHGKMARIVQLKVQMTNE